MPPADASRKKAIEAAGFNILNLQPSDIEFDFFTDVPWAIAVPDVAERAAEVIGNRLPKPTIEPACRNLYGDFQFAFVTKGRAAELALVDALQWQRPVVVSHGLFATTQRALSICGASHEVLPVQGGGVCDIDLDALSNRFRSAEKPTAVYLEVANNRHFSRPLSMDNLRAVREICDVHGAALVLDATRVLTNLSLLGLDPISDVESYLSLAHAFTISLGKECFVPIGAVVGSKDPQLIGRARLYAFQRGIEIEDPGTAASMAAGLRYIASNPEMIHARVERVAFLAECLEREGVTVHQPAGGHAVYFDVDTPEPSLEEAFALLAHLFEHAGVRGQAVFGAGVGRIRLALPLVGLDTSALAEAAKRVAMFAADLESVPTFRVAPGQDMKILYRRHFEIVESG